MRKKSAGEEVIPERVKGLFFEDQSAVNDFVASYNDVSIPKVRAIECSSSSSY